MEVPRQKRKYEKKQKVLPLSSGASHHQGPAVFNAKDLNQYDFPSSDDEPFSQVPAAPPPGFQRFRFCSCCNLDALFAAAFGLVGGRRGERPRWRLRLSQESRLPVLCCKWRCDWDVPVLPAAARSHRLLLRVTPSLCLQPRQDCVGSWPWCGAAEDGLAEARFRYSLTTVTVPRRCLGMARRRVGRGGRWVRVPTSSSAHS